MDCQLIMGLAILFLSTGANALQPASITTGTTGVTTAAAVTTKTLDPTIYAVATVAPAT